MMIQTFAAASSLSRFCFKISSILGGCFLVAVDPQPFFFFGCTRSGPRDSSEDGGGGGIPFELGGGGGCVNGSGGGGGGTPFIF